MNFPSPVSIQWIADLIGAQVLGNKDALAKGINEIHRVEPGDLVFVDHPKYYDKCINSAASFIIINKKTEFPEGKALLVTDQPFEAYQKIVRHFRPFSYTSELKSTLAQVDASAYIAPNVFLGQHVKIGKNTVIHPNVTILEYCEIGDNVVIQAGTVIGSNAFYYNTKKDREVWYKRMESGGRVIIEDDVEIGAGCTIDRGVSHDTIIGKGSKLDNLIHIGHDTIVGKNCLIAAQVGIAGATTLGDGVILWGQVGVSKTLSIGDNAVVFAQSGVHKTIEGGKIYFGSPVEDAGDKKKELVWIKRIPALWKKVMGEE
ncbi:MAG: UDP-3-O-(3-hydroxymyristoyl)glucosamine N-acyltransferase [Chitinophagaceae bacterium]|jgi:UDP-3-O-[3-hydroxymyristoyl] glucosamine N-acyltransferase|nr:MAG: UDP-3-O-(3-hydroxymyristoyl)glucosamine N-acyltransferase [Chitinophagaceae bacterium]